MDLEPVVSEWRKHRPAEAVDAAGAPRGDSLSTSAAERIAGIIDGIIGEAGKQGERGVAKTRLIAGGIGLVVWPAATWGEVGHGSTSTGLVSAFLAVMVLFSLATLALVRRAQRGAVLPIASIVVDVVLILGMLATFVPWHGETYSGLAHLSGFGVVYLGIIATGVRLSRRGVVVGASLFAIGVAALLWADARTSPDVVDMTVPHLATVGILVVCSSVFAYSIAARARRLVVDAANQAVLADRARSRLGSYVSEDVAREAMSHEELQMGGVRCEAAILFADLRGFTSYAEHLPPEELVAQLNRYLFVMVGVLNDHGAYVDKFIGDAIMAVFGVPNAAPDDAARAMAAAAAMDRALDAHNRDRARRGQPPLLHGIGVHFGECVAGNVGTSGRANYTVIGDAVNLAARLESATKDVAVRVLFSQALVDAARASGHPSLPAVSARGSIQVKGRDQAVAVLTLDDKVAA